MKNGKVYGNKHGNTSPERGWNNSSIVAGTRIGLKLEFCQAGTATVTGYKDGVRIGVLTTGKIRGPLHPTFWASQPPVSVEFVSSRLPHS